jgi:hypothetical protein
MYVDRSTESTNYYLTIFGLAGRERELNLFNRRGMGQEEKPKRQGNELRMVDLDGG